MAPPTHTSMKKKSIKRHGMKKNRAITWCRGLTKAKTLQHRLNILRQNVRPHAGPIRSTFPLHSSSVHQKFASVLLILQTPFQLPPTTSHSRPRTRFCSWNSSVPTMTWPVRSKNDLWNLTIISTLFFIFLLTYDDYLEFKKRIVSQASLSTISEWKLYSSSRSQVQVHPWSWTVRFWKVELPSSFNHE